MNTQGAVKVHTKLTYHEKIKAENFRIEINQQELYES